MCLVSALLETMQKFSLDSKADSSTKLWHKEKQTIASVIVCSSFYFDMCYVVKQWGLIPPNSEMGGEEIFKSIMLHT